MKHDIRLSDAAHTLRVQWMIIDGLICFSTHSKSLTWDADFLVLSLLLPTVMQVYIAYHCTNSMHFLHFSDNFLSSFISQMNLIVQCASLFCNSIQVFILPVHFVSHVRAHCLQPEHHIMHLM